MTTLEVLCTECGKPIEQIGTAVALRFTIVDDRGNWANRKLPGTFHSSCAEAAFRRNAKTFANPDPWTRLGRWLTDLEYGPYRRWTYLPAAPHATVSLWQSRTLIVRCKGPTVEAALTAALDRAIASEAKREGGAT